MAKVSGTTDSLQAIDLTDQMPSHIPQEQAHAFLADLDISNFLFVYSFNITEDGLMDQYREAQQNLHLWQAWEAASTEENVKIKTREHSLPSDSLMKSILARNSYRAKVVDVLRERGSWLTETSTRPGDKTLKVPRSEARGAIVQTLSAIIPPSFEDVEAVLKPIVNSLLQDTDNSKQKPLFTLVSHSYDRVAKKVLTAVKTFTFDIHLGAEGVGGMVEVKIQFLLTGSTFNHDIWNREKSGIEDSLVKAGEAIVKKSTLHLAAGWQ